jgi:hypothetical protein
MKTCSECGFTADEKEFPSAGCVNGKKYYRKRCGRCYWLFNKKPLRVKISKWFENFKKQFSCKDCGTKDHRVLEFHHRDPLLKDFNIGDAGHLGCGKEKILKEIKKCDCFCANCHRVLTYESRKAA